MLALFYLAVGPMSVSAFRKIQSIGRADLFVSAVGDAYRVRYVGESARGTGLRRGDLLRSVDGVPAVAAGDPSRLLADHAAALEIERYGKALHVTSTPVAFWDVRYFLLFA